MQKILQCQDLTPDWASIPYPIHLSEREQQVLRLIVEGYSNPQIAADLHLSVSTIKTHIRGIMNKFVVQHRIQIAVFAVRNQLV
jgi:NarL family two-component system response regulator LiaR